MNQVDWHVAEDEPSSPPDGERSPRAPRGRPRWPLWLALLVLVAGGLFGWYLHRQEEALRADLRESILQEERIRLAGRQEEADKLAVRDAGTEWLSRYRATFRSLAGGSPVDVAVERADLQGDLVVTTVKVGTDRQLRAYRLEQRRWRRAPLPARVWEARQELRVTDGIQISYRERDRRFAEQLAETLPALLDSLRTLDVDIRLDEIRLEPRELDGPLLEPLAGNGVLVLNSPLVTVSQEGLDGRGAVRLALARALAAQADSPDASRVRGAVQLSRAVPQVAAFDWALSATEQARQRATWRTRLTSDRYSLFFRGVQQPAEQTIDFWTPALREAAALLTADYLYRTEGVETVAAILREAATAHAWDEILPALLGRHAIELDREVTIYVQEGWRAAGRARERPTRPSDIQLPVTVERLERAADEANTYLAHVKGQAARLQVDMGRAEVYRSDGAELSRRCLEVHGPITVTGDWKEVGQQLIATRAVVEAIEPVPPEVTAQTSAALAYVVVDGGETGETLLALHDDGTSSPLVRLDAPSPELNRFAVIGVVEGEAGEVEGILLRHVVPDCDYQGIFYYDLLAGEFSWRHRLDAAGWELQSEIIERPDQGDVTVVFHQLREQTLELRSLDTDRDRFPVMGEFPGTVEIVDWDGSSEHFLVIRRDRPIPGRAELGLALPGTGALLRPVGLQGFPHVTLWDPDSRRLYYATARREGEGWLDGTDLRLVDLDGRTDRLLLPSDQSRPASRVPVDLYNDRLLVLSEPAGETAQEPTRLLLIDPDAPEQARVLLELTEGRLAAHTIQSCSDGSLLYVVAQGGERELHRWHPGTGTTERLLASNGRLHLLACR